MPMLLIVVAGAAIAIALVWSGAVTRPRLLAAVYAVLGAVLGIVILRFVAGPMGPGGLVVAAAVGAVILLWLVTRSAGGSAD